MQVTLLRGRDGRVIFMECHSQFVDALMAITKSPLASVVGAIAVDDSLGPCQVQPGKDMCESLTSLREEIFASKKSDVLLPPMDLEGIVTAAARASISVLGMNQVSDQKVDEKLKLTSNGKGWNTNAVLDVGGRPDFELSLCGSWTTTNTMIGIAPATVKAATQNFHTSCGFFMHVHGTTPCSLYGKDGTSNKQLGITPQGDLLKMKLMNGATSPVLQFAFGDGPFVTATFNQAIPADETYRPAICFYAANTSVMVGDTNQVNKVMNSTVTFLISNRLQVMENSSTSAIELIAKRNGESLVGLRSESVQVTASAWRRLIAGTLLGRDDILDFAFPATEAAAGKSDADAVSTAGGSESSFQLAFPEPASA